MQLIKTNLVLFTYMVIRINLDVMPAKRKIYVTELGNRVGLTLTGLSLFKRGKLKGVRFSSLNAIFRELERQPCGVLEFVPDEGSVEE